MDTPNATKLYGHPNRAGWFTAGRVECDPVPPPREHPARLVLLGPPGVGKGTQAERLCARLRACHLSTGDVFRHVQCQGVASPAMVSAIESMRRGELVPEEIVIQVVRERAGCLLCHGGFLLDGFPRTLRQARALAEMLSELNVAINAALSFELPVEKIVARLSGRRVCPSCRATYHVVAQPPAVAGVCNHCGAALTQRDDDRPEAIQLRMQLYESETLPLLDFYRQASLLVSVPAEGTPDEIHERAMTLLGPRLERSGAA